MYQPQDSPQNRRKVRAQVTAVPCADARAQLAQERQTLAALEAKQRSAAAGDAVGVFLIGVPVSSLTGNDVSGQIGASKGKVLALESRVMSCG